MTDPLPLSVHSRVLPSATRHHELTGGKTFHMCGSVEMTYSKDKQAWTCDPAYPVRPLIHSGDVLRLPAIYASERPS